MFGINCKLSSGVDEVSTMIGDLLALTKKQVLVGVPEEMDDFKTGEAMRREAGGKKREVGNAFLAYVHDNGSPLASIPARPFMRPGIAKAQDRVNDQFFAAAKAQINSQPEEVDVRLNRAGLIAQNAIKGVINEGEGFEPITRATALGRMRAKGYTKKWTKEKREETIDSLHPLIDTGSLRNSITYSIEDIE